MKYLYIGFTVLLTVYGQLVIKWQVSSLGAIPSGGAEKIFFFCRLIVNPWVLSAYAAALLASVAWMGAVSKMPISEAYPFMSTAFVLVMLLGSFFFGETLTLNKILGIALIMLGLAVGSRG